MKVLVAAAGYPTPDGDVTLYYIHTRNRYYISQGIDVAVLNFGAKEDYEIDGIPVYTTKSQSKILKHVTFDVLICHAANLRNHYLLLKKYGSLFPKIIFIFHGHEVLRCIKVYPKPYSYTKQKGLVTSYIKDLYDIVKLRMWKRAYERLAIKSWFVFVSEWMYREFLLWVNVDPQIIENRKRVIYNSVGVAFEHESYDRNAPKIYDFITIRNCLDGSKYGIDIVTGLARSNPQYHFCIVGKGDFFAFNHKPSNVTVIEKYVSHREIIEILNQSRCGLMPTRVDAQGVMACEFATFGIPLITSDIPVCREVFADFNNVGFISNQTANIDLTGIYRSLISAESTKKNRKFFAENTSGKEVELLIDIMGEKQS
jgi:glycosyltransferase involved in cell wall biosynthesis